MHVDTNTSDQTSTHQYWTNKLKIQSRLQIPQCKRLPAQRNYHTKTIDFHISQKILSAIHFHCLEHEISQFDVLLSAYKALLFRYSTSSDITIAVLESGESLLQTNGKNVQIPNLLFARTLIDQRDTFDQLSKKVQKACQKAKTNQLTNLADSCRPMNEIDIGLLPPFTSYLFQLSDRPIIALKSIKSAAAPTSPYDLALQIHTGSEQFQCRLTYSSELFKTIDIERLKGHYIRILESALQQSDEKIIRLSYLSTEEKKWLLKANTDTLTDYNSSDGVENQIWQNANQNPEKIAVRFNTQSLSYKELTTKADSLAAWIQRQSTEENRLFGVFLNRGIDLLVALLAILRSGGAYLPLDPAYPPERIAYILEDAKVPLLITESQLLPNIPNTQTKLAVLDEVWPEVMQAHPSCTHSQTTTENLAYTIYTSGSTGKPKGVQITRKNLCNFLFAMQQKPGLIDQDNLLAITTVSFDISVLEFFLPLICGASVTIVSREEAIDGYSLVNIIETNKITIMQATPSSWRLLLEADWQGTKGLKALVGGEALPLDLIEPLLNRVDSLWNMYGPTETTVWSSLSPIKDAIAPVTIGKAIANTQIYILGPDDQLCPINIPGELCIAGDGVALGYVNRPNLTAKKFVVNPFSTNNTRMYRTGDLARWTESAEIEYLSRLDNQVKLRGYRIELGEIEACLTQLKSINNCVLVVHTDKAGNSDLVAYLVSSDRKKTTDLELIKHLGKNLPDYMIPRYYMWLNVIPQTPNGKVDKKALPEPTHFDSTPNNKTIAATNTEKRIITIWQELLQTTSIDLQDNFFSVGGHSLLAMRFIAIVRDQLDFEIPVRTVMTSSLQQIARMISPEDYFTPNQNTHKNIIEPLFIGAPESQLYGVLHTHSDYCADKLPILICQPIGHEYMRCHRSVRILATELARKGYPVFRFDYAGSGDSAHQLQDVHLYYWKENIEFAKDYLLNRYSAKKCHIIAIRFGAALTLTSNLQLIDKSILWDPVLEGKKYIEDLEAFHQHALNDLDRYRWCQKNTNQYELLGYQYNREMYRDIQEVKCNSTQLNTTVTTQIVLSIDNASIKINEGDHHKTVDKNITFVPDTQHWDQPEYMDDIILAYPAINAILEFF